MKTLTYSLFVAATLLSGLSAQERDDPNQVQLSPRIAETLLIHKEEPPCHKDQPYGLKISGTVVIAIVIDKNGKVNRARSLSGPSVLRPLALAAVRKYLYKPYLHNHAPVVVRTVVSIPFDCFIHKGQA
jgi:hypothetical protein